MERTLSIDEVAALMPEPPAETPPSAPRVVRLVANGGPQLSSEDDESGRDQAARFSRGLDRIFGGEEAAVLSFRKEDGGRG